MAARITADFPGDVLLGEEGERVLGDVPANNVRWIVDPLDGTFNFVRGFPYVATSIAVEVDGAVQRGHYQPVIGEVFCAGKGFGAWLHRVDQPPVRLAVNCEHTCQRPDRLCAAVSGEQKLRAGATSVARRCLPCRQHPPHRRGRAGSAQVAAGRLDGFFVMSLQCLGRGRRALLVTEAGGVVCDFTGGNDFLTSNQVIAGSAVVAAELAAVLVSTPSAPAESNVEIFRAKASSQVKQRDKWWRSFGESVLSQDLRSRRLRPLLCDTDTAAGQRVHSDAGAGRGATGGPHRSLHVAQRRHCGAVARRQHPVQDPDHLQHGFDGRRLPCIHAISNAAWSFWVAPVPSAFADRSTLSWRWFIPAAIPDADPSAIGDDAPARGGLVQR